MEKFIGRARCYKFLGRLNNIYIYIIIIYDHNIYMSLSDFGYQLAQKYKKLVNLQQIDRYDLNTGFQGSCTVASNLNVLQKSVLEGEVTFNSPLSLKKYQISRWNT